MTSNLVNLILFILLGIYPTYLLFIDIQDDHDEMATMGTIVAATFIDLVLYLFASKGVWKENGIKIMLFFEYSLTLFMCLRCIVAVPITISHHNTNPNGGGSLDQYMMCGYLLLAMSIVAYHRKSYFIPPKKSQLS